MILASGKPVSDQGLGSVEKDDANIVTSVHQQFTVGAFQRRTGDHDMATVAGYPVDLVRNRLQPWPAILIGEGTARAHLGDIAGGVKPVAVLEGPAELFGELDRDRTFARARHTHHNQGAWWLCSLNAHEGSPPI